MLVLALLLDGGTPARAQASDGARPATFAPTAPSAPGGTFDRERAVRAALARAIPAPRVAALVQEILPPDVQVVVVRDAPAGLGAYHPGLALAGYEHVHASQRGRHVLTGPWGLIVLDARLEERASREAIAFVLAHEYAHHQLRGAHTEADADAYARRTLIPLGLWSPHAAEGAFELAAGLPFARHLVPAVGARLRALEATAAQATATP